MERQKKRSKKLRVHEVENVFKKLITRKKERRNEMARITKNVENGYNCC